MIEQIFIPLDHANIKMQIILAHNLHKVLYFLHPTHTHKCRIIVFRSLTRRLIWGQRKVQYKNGGFELSIWLSDCYKLFFHGMVSQTWSPQTLTTQSSVLKVCFALHLNPKLAVQTVNSYCWFLHKNLLHRFYLAISLTPVRGKTSNFNKTRCNVHIKLPVIK